MQAMEQRRRKGANKGVNEVDSVNQHPEAKSSGSRPARSSMLPSLLHEVCPLHERQFNRAAAVASSSSIPDHQIIIREEDSKLVRRFPSAFW